MLHFNIEISGQALAAVWVLHDVVAVEEAGRCGSGTQERHGMAAQYALTNCDKLRHSKVPLIR